MSDEQRRPGSPPTDTHRTDFQETAVSRSYPDIPTGFRVRPPIRWAGVVWGLILLCLATATLYVGSTPERIRAIRDWLWNLDAGGAWALALAVVGGIIVVSALLGAIRGAQRRQ